jgi:two-component system OmpR family sensor kinase
VIQVIRRSSLRWRLIAWVIGVMLVVSAIVFVVVYEQTGSQLQAQVDDDVRGDINQLSQTVRSLGPPDAGRRYLELTRYLTARPFTGTSTLLFAVVPDHGTVSNHAALFDFSTPSGDGTAKRRDQERLGRALLRGPAGLRSAPVPDAGEIRLDERLITVDGERLRIGAGEPLESVTRAQRSVARSFLIAGALGLLLVLIASYLAGASVSRPLRRMARVAARVDDGDLEPRMSASPSAAAEIRVLAETFNRMLDRLAISFHRQRDFIADASHELRTPLTVIAGQLEVLATQTHPGPADIQRTQRLVSAEVARTARMVDDMLLLARSDQHDFLRHRRIDLPQFVADLWTVTIAGHRRRFELGSVPAGILVGDPDRIAQALRNLIDNACAHTAAPDGLVRLEITPVTDERCRFTIVDDGPGIPGLERERVFERFHRTDESRGRVAGGTGLGLAIVRAIAEAHGGSVAALTPLAGVGARLALTIPGFSPHLDVGDRPANRSARQVAPRSSSAAAADEDDLFDVR